MSYNGSGQFQINTTGQPVVTGTTISSTAFNALTADLATGLSTAITKDGQTTVTANIPMSGNKITGLGNATVATDAMAYGQFTAFGVPGFTTTATAAGTTTLTVSSTQQQYFTGTTTQTVVLPVAGTLVAGQSYRVVNLSTGVVTVNSSGGNLVVAIVPGTATLITCVLASGTDAASWDIKYSGFGSVTGTGANVLATSPTLVTPVLGVATATSINKVTITAPATGSTLTIADGKTLTANASLALAGTDSTTMTFPPTSQTVAGLGVVQAWTKSQSGAPVSLTSSSNSIAVDLSLGNNFSHTFTENTTLANPSNPVAGTSGQIAFTQNASAAKTLAYGSQWIEATSGTAPAVSTTTSAQNILSFYVFDTTHIYYVLNKHGVA
jgi:hypothetical protein